MSMLVGQIKRFASYMCTGSTALVRNSRCSFVYNIKPLRTITASISHCGLDEFLPKKGDLPDEDGKLQIGRCWRISELRVKSYVDLHKLWYVLVKERNMLLTMEHEARRQHIAMPGPERLTKVKISMKRIKTVLREREKARKEISQISTESRTEILEEIRD